MASMSGWRITRAGGIFIVVTILLAGLLIGGIYLVRERGKQARQQEAAEIARQNLEEVADGPVVIAREEPEPTAPDTNTTDPTPTELPETGPASLGLLAVAALTFFSAAYGVSRQALQRAGIRR